MGLFGKKKRGTIDFTKMSDARIPMNRNYKFEGEAVDLRDKSSSNKSDVADPFSGISDDSSSTSSGSSGGLFGFLDSSPKNSTQSTSYPDTNIVNEVSEISTLKTNMRKISSQVEDHSNEVYRLMQRIELLEKKVQRFEGR